MKLDKIEKCIIAAFIICCCLFPCCYMGRNIYVLKMRLKYIEIYCSNSAIYKTDTFTVNGDRMHGIDNVMGSYNRNIYRFWEFGLRDMAQDKKKFDYVLNCSKQASSFK